MPKRKKKRKTKSPFRFELRPKQKETKDYPEFYYHYYRLSDQQGVFYNAAETPAPMVFSKPLSTGWPEDVKIYNLRWSWLAKLVARIGNFISRRLK